MPAHDYENSDLELWLRKKHMSTNEFVQLVGCSRPVVWKVKKGLPICPLYAKRIMEITLNEVNPKVELVGGRR